MPVGQLVTTGTTADFTLTRDQLIQAAYETAGLMEEGAVCSPEQLNIGIVRLNLIVREVDESGNFVWTTEEPFHLPLQANVGVYDANSALPTNISQLLSAVYRSANGTDSCPLKILKAEGYEEISNKLENGEPKAVYLTNDRQLERRRLYVCPFLSSVATQSRVLGTDNNIYKCIYPHTSALVTKPVTGANWRMVWELGTGSTTTWAANTAYTISESLRIVRKRPLVDFDSGGNAPDFPLQWPRLLVLRLAQDVGMVYRIPQADKDTLAAMIRGAFTDIFPSTRPKSNNIHNKTQYF